MGEKRIIIYLVGYIYQITLLPDEIQSTLTVFPCWVVKEAPHWAPFIPSLTIFSICSSNCWDGAKLISSKNSSSIFIGLWPTIEDTILVELSTFPTVLWPNIKM